MRLCPPSVGPKVRALVETNVSASAPGRNIRLDERADLGPDRRRAESHRGPHRAGRGGSEGLCERTVHLRPHRSGRWVRPIIMQRCAGRGVLCGVAHGPVEGSRDQATGSSHRTQCSPSRPSRIRKPRPLLGQVEDKQLFLCILRPLQCEDQFAETVAPSVIDLKPALSMPTRFFVWQPSETIRLSHRRNRARNYLPRHQPPY